MINAIAAGAALYALFYILLTTYNTIDADGSWYNELYSEKGRDNVRFIDKLKYTVFEDGRNLAYDRLFLGLTVVPVAVYVLVRVFVIGIINF